MSRCHPAILMVPRGSRSEDDLPHPSEVTDVVVDALETAGWSSPADMVVDVREGEVQYQDEFPPEPPIELHGVTVALGQCPVTSPFGYDGPFQLVLDRLADEYGEVSELAVDAVEL